MSPAPARSARDSHLASTGPPLPIVPSSPSSSLSFVMASHQDEVIDPITLSDVTDLPVSTSLTTDDFLPVLRARFLEGLPYTAVSPRLLVSVNPHHFVQVNSDAVLVDWATEFADCGTEDVRGRLGPHVWAMSGRAYYYMRRTGQDQTIVLRSVQLPVSSEPALRVTNASCSPRPHFRSLQRRDGFRQD